MAKSWGEAGRNIGINLRSMSPAQAEAFVEYMDYRFSQGDYKRKYVIDEFNELCKPIFETIITNKYENEQLANLRDALLPKLMSGEIDVDKVEV